MTGPTRQEDRKTRNVDHPDAITASWINRLLLWLLPLSFLAVFFFYPFFRILAYSFSIESLKSSNLQLAYHVLIFTLYQSVLSTLLTLLIGLPAAYLFARFDFRGKTLLRALTVIPFMLPTVVVAAGFNALLGPRGWVNLGLMRFLALESPPIPFVGTLGAILIAHVFYNTTIIIRTVGNALSGLDPKLEQAARSLGADSRRVWWYVSLPILRSSLLAASLLVFLFDFTSFGVILLLGGPAFATLEVEIYIQALELLNLPVAALLAFIQLLCTLAFAILYSRISFRSTVQSAPRAGGSNIRKPKTSLERVFLTRILIPLIRFFILPLLPFPLRSLARLDADRAQHVRVPVDLTADYYNELFPN